MGNPRILALVLLGDSTSRLDLAFPFRGHQFHGFCGSAPQCARPPQNRPSFCPASSPNGTNRQGTPHLSQGRHGKPSGSNGQGFGTEVYEAFISQPNWIYSPPPTSIITGSEKVGIPSMTIPIDPPGGSHSNRITKS